LPKSQVLSSKREREDASGDSEDGEEDHDEIIRTLTFPENGYSLRERE